jgi:transcriptional regulator with XRE-family HTH domain
VEIGMRDESLYEALGRLIREKRDARKMTQGDLADLVELSRASVTNIELGRQSLLLDQLYRFAAALRVRPEELLPPPNIESEQKEREKLSPKGEHWIERERRSVE